MAGSELYAGIEAGGTHFNCMVASGPGEIAASGTIPTRGPGETLRAVCGFLRPYRDAGRIRAMGVGSFGPCDIDPGSPKFGYITSTPKPGWQDTDVVGFLRGELGLPLGFDTDVNAAALGEFTWGEHAGQEPLLYLTVGTGIGGGVIIGKEPHHGLRHPEMGHIRVAHDKERDPFPGSCPYHGDCLEGLAAGPAIQRRFGRRGEELGDNDDFWDLEAEYVAAALCSLILVLSPRRIVLGGGIMGRTGLHHLIREKVRQGLAGYADAAEVDSRLESYIVRPSLGTQSGMLGAIALAKRAAAAG